MKLKISTPSKVIFEGTIEKVSIPTENGNLKVMAGNAPMVTTVKPGIIKIRPMENDVKVGQELLVSTSKGMIFVDGKIIRIVATEATTTPSESTEALLAQKKTLGEKIKRLKSEGSIEEIEKTLMRLGKIDADLELKKMLQTA